MFRSKMYFLTLLLCLFPLEVMSNPVLSCDSGPCSAGQFLDIINNQCLECPEGTFSDQNGHQCKECRPCTTADPHSYQQMLRPCTKTMDTVLGCLTGFYAEGRPHELDCNPCSHCGQGQRVIEICGGETDTVCGDEEAGTTVTANPIHENIAPFCESTIIVFVFAGISILII